MKENLKIAFQKNVDKYGIPKKVYLDNPKISLSKKSSAGSYEAERG